MAPFCLNVKHLMQIILPVNMSCPELFASGFQQKAWIVGVVEESCSPGDGDFAAWVRKHRFLVSLGDLRIKVSRLISDNYLRAGIHPRFILFSVDLSSSCSASNRFDRSVSISKISLLLGCVASNAWRGAAKITWNAAWYSLMELNRSWWKFDELFVVQVRMDASLTISDLAHPDTSSTSLSCKRVEECWRALRIKVMEYDIICIRGIQSMMSHIKVYDITQ